MQGEILSDNEQTVLSRETQIAVDAELCLQLQRREEQQVGALNAATSASSTFDAAATASAGSSSSAHAAYWRVKTTGGSKADRKAARQPVHDAARNIQSSARARLTSLRAKEEARFQSELQQALRESVGASPSASASSAAASFAACAENPISVRPTASFTAAASAAAATSRTAPTPTSGATLAPIVNPTASSTTVAPSTAATSTTAATGAASAPTAADLAPVSVSSTFAVSTTPSTALTQIASSAFVFSPRQSQKMLPERTYLPPCPMAVTMGPWGQHVLLWDMESHQPAPHKHGEPTHFNAQNEPVNARGKSYVPPPPPGPRGCNGGSHRSWVKREKEKAKRQQKRAATGQ